MNRPILFLVAIVAVIISSCANKHEGVIVDDELVRFYEAFKEEAAARGVIFENSEAMIEGYIQDIQSVGVLGACKRNENSDENSQIFLDEPTWNNSTHLEREYVMFHELGHCFLRLSHDEAVDSVGDCASIMASGLSGCRNNYNEANRERLLDELFSK